MAPGDDGARECDLHTAWAAALSSWGFEPGFVALAIASGWVYWRGWRALHARRPEHFPPWRLGAFWSGLTLLWVATASPLDAFANFLLQAHMLQHVLLTLAVPPLLWLGAPWGPMLQGLPRSWLRDGLGPFLASPRLQGFARGVVHPAVAWPLYVVTLWVWHWPGAYELALRSPFWHDVEHLCFLAAGLVFWFPVVQPWPSRPVWPRAAMLPYLVLAALQNSAFAALFTFSDRVFYDVYARAPRVLDLSALADQAAAGALMWGLGAIASLFALVAVSVELLESRGVRPSRAQAPPTSPQPKPAQGAQAWRRLANHHARTARKTVRAVLVGLAALLVVDGWFGPEQPSASNLAGVLPWTYWRGLLVVGLLVAGNWFCGVCPFTVSRGLARRLRPNPRSWPDALRNKWLAAGLLLLFLGSYEVFSLWNQPGWTAWVVVGFFAASFLVDVTFTRGSFCKYACPIGQFSFVFSQLSPVEVSVDAPDVCQRCTTQDCIRGNAQQTGCEMALFQPRKLGNLDCTFCLDCASACPHDNVSLQTTTPGSGLVTDAARSGIGRLSQRGDVAALTGLLVIGAYANAAGMLAPTARMEQSLGQALGVETPAVVTTLWLMVALVALPAVLWWTLTRWSARAGGLGAARVEFGRRMLAAGVPLGFAMWLGHFAGHLWAGRWTAVPALQRALGDTGLPGMGNPDWSLAMASALSPTWISWEIAVLGVGWLASLALGWRVACDYRKDAAGALALLLPWALLAAGLYGTGVWIFLQPMEMRGTWM